MQCKGCARNEQSEGRHTHLRNDLGGKALELLATERDAIRRSHTSDADSKTEVVAEPFAKSRQLVKSSAQVVLEK